MKQSPYRLLITALTQLLVFAYSTIAAPAYEQLVYNNLLKSRDALALQRADLQKAYDDTQREIDALKARLARIDTYLKQVNASMKDVNTALVYAR